jgi:hypothetical protein
MGSAGLLRPRGLCHRGAVGDRLAHGLWLLLQVADLLLQRVDLGLLRRRCQRLGLRCRLWLIVVVV